MNNSEILYEMYKKLNLMDQLKVIFGSIEKSHGSMVLDSWYKTLDPVVVELPNRIDESILVVIKWYDKTRVNLEMIPLNNRKEINSVLNKYQKIFSK